MILMTLTADVLELFIMFMGVIPIITPIALGISYLINTFVLAVILFWFIIKGERGARILSRVLIGNFLEYVPFLNVLPLRTVSCAMAIYLANHPKIKQIATIKTNRDKASKSNKNKKESEHEPKKQVEETA